MVLRPGQRRPIDASGLTSRRCGSRCLGGAGANARARCLIAELASGHGRICIVENAGRHVASAGAPRLFSRRDAQPGRLGPERHSVGFLERSKWPTTRGAPAQPWNRCTSSYSRLCRRGQIPAGTNIGSRQPHRNRMKLARRRERNSRQHQAHRPLGGKIGRVSAGTGLTRHCARRRAIHDLPCGPKESRGYRPEPATGDSTRWPV
jgi:hypothetical protein